MGHFWNGGATYCADTVGQIVYVGGGPNFITIQWTLSNAQLVDNSQKKDFQIDAQILYIRRAGRQLPNGAA